MSNHKLGKNHIYLIDLGYVEIFLFLFLILRLFWLLQGQVFGHRYGQFAILSMIGIHVVKM